MEFLKFEETRNFLLNRKRLRVDYIYGGGSDRGYDFQKQLKIGGYSFLFAGGGGRGTISSFAFSPYEDHKLKH